MTIRESFRFWRQCALTAALALTQMPAHAHDTDPFEGVTAFSQTTQFGTFSRYVLYLRPTAPSASSAPVVILLHYLRGRSDDMADLVAAGRLARDYGAWVILPEAVNGVWNYGAGAATGLVSPLVDDVGFLNDLITRAVADYPIDARRVYMGGYSNGGLMSMRFACEHPEAIAAAGNIARVSIKSADARACKPALATPMLLVNGTADPVSIYDGSSLGGLSQTLSSPATAAFWAKTDGCAATPVGSALPDTVDDGTTTHLDTFTGCKDLSEVAFYSVNGGGHTWPGSAGFAPELGITAQDFDATQLLWDFFKRFSRP